jgi:hypothetical protein
MNRRASGVQWRELKDREPSAVGRVSLQTAKKMGQLYEIKQPKGFRCPVATELLL